MSILESVNREKIVANMAGIIEKFLVWQFNEWTTIRYEQELLYEEVFQYWRANLIHGRHMPDPARSETREVFVAGLSRLFKNGVISHSNGVLGLGVGEVGFIPRADRGKPRTYVEKNKDLWDRRRKAGDEILQILTRHGINFDYENGGYHTSERFVPESVEDLEELAKLLKTRLR